MKYIYILVITLFVVLGSGCAEKAPELANNTSGQLPQNNTPEITNDSQISNMNNMDENVKYGSTDERIAAIAQEVEPIYFATDSYTISPSEHEKVDSDAAIFNGDLAQDLSIRVEGNCDEWGTDEYNYALGLKRAKSAKDALSVAGVNEGRMALISYGESKPVCSEHNDACWQQNRRADFTLLP